MLYNYSRNEICWNNIALYPIKNKTNQNDLENYTQAFVDQLEGKNLMFIDKNFSMSNLDSNKECTI